MTNKPIMFCIVGESGSGKTMIAEAIEKYADIHLIQSYTDRPKRTPEENGHTFLSKEEFDAIEPDSMIASTEWNGYRYCCTKNDLNPINIYIIDCFGLEHLRTHFSDAYKIYAIRLHRPIDDRIKSVGKERVERDKGKFYLEDEVFDKIVYNICGCKLDVITEVWLYMRSVLTGAGQYDRDIEYEYLRD